MARTERDVAIECRGIWKVIEPQATRAMEAILREDLSRSEVRDRFG